jgi:hypothetical protein
MPLEGDLKEFGVAEIFQLLEHQAKTGCLLLSTGASRIDVYFLKGGIVGVVPDGRTPSEHLLETLEKTGFLPESEQTKIRALLRKDLRGLREILQQENLLEPREMDLVLKERIKDLLFPVLSGRQGRFLFDPEKNLSEEWVLSEPLAVEPIVLEGLRRNDEWPILKRKIGSCLAVPRRQFVPEPEDRVSWKAGFHRFLRPHAVSATQDSPEGDLFSDQAEALSPVGQVVYGLIDGKRTVEEIVRASSLGEYACCKALLDLRDGGRIRIDPVERAAEGGVSAGARLGLGRWVMAALGLVVVFLGVSIFSRSVNITWVGYPTGEAAQVVSRLMNQHKRTKVMRALELYREERARVPAALSDLVHVHLLLESDLSLWGKNAFAYTSEPPDAFRLLIVPAQ